MKKFLLFFALVAILFAPKTISAAQTTGKAGDNITYSFDTDTRTLTLEGTGAMTQFAEDEAPWQDYTNNDFTDANGDIYIKQIIIGEGITEIGHFSYLGDRVRSVTFPKSLRNIRKSAFEGTTLIEIRLQDGVKTIGDYAFADCGASTIYLPKSVTNIEEMAFNGNAQNLKLYVYWQTVAELPKLGEDVFDLYEQSVLYVPATKKSLYESQDVWKEFTIVEEKPTGIGVLIAGEDIQPSQVDEEGYIQSSNITRGKVHYEKSSSDKISLTMYDATIDGGIYGDIDYLYVDGDCSITATDADAIAGVVVFRIYNATEQGGSLNIASKNGNGIASIDYATVLDINDNVPLAAGKAFRISIQAGKYGIATSYEKYDSMVAIFNTSKGEDGKTLYSNLDVSISGKEGVLYAPVGRTISFNTPDDMIKVEDDKSNGYYTVRYKSELLNSQFTLNGKKALYYNFPIDFSTDNIDGIKGRGVLDYDFATNTITLENVDIESSLKNGEDEECVIYLGGPYDYRELIIELKGTNKIEAEDVSVLGIRGHEDTSTSYTIRGGGTLELISGKSYAIATDDALTIQSTTVRAKSYDSNAVFNGWEGNITVKNANLFLLSADDKEPFVSLKASAMGMTMGGNRISLRGDSKITYPTETVTFNDELKNYMEGDGITYYLGGYVTSDNTPVLGRLDITSPTTGLEEIVANDSYHSDNVHKVFDPATGAIYILRDGKAYNILGAEMK